MRTFIVVAGLLITGIGTAFSQDTELRRDDFDEIVIRKKGGQHSKVTIEIKEGEVKVNGKPLEEFEDEGLTVRKRKIPRIHMSSPPRFREMYLFPENMEGDLLETPLNTQRAQKKALLGVTTENVKEGARVTLVMEGSSAAKAGMEKGDIITKVNQDKIETTADLIKAINSYQPDEEVSITYIREGKVETKVVRLGKNANSMTRSFEFNMPDSFYLSLPPVNGLPDVERIPEMNQDFYFKWKDQQNEPPFFLGMQGRPRLGIKAQDLDEGKGVRVLEVTPLSAAEKAGVKEGDIIQRFDGKEVNSADSLVETAAASRNKESIEVELLRDGKKQIVELKVPKKRKTAQL